MKRDEFLWDYEYLSTYWVLLGYMVMSLRSLFSDNTICADNLIILVLNTFSFLIVWHEQLY
jgi:hypothetical protein